MTLEESRSAISVSASFVLCTCVWTFMDVPGGNFLAGPVAVDHGAHISPAAGALYHHGASVRPQASGVANDFVTLTCGPSSERRATRQHAAGLISAGGIVAVKSPPEGGRAFLIMQFLNVSFLDVLSWQLEPTLLILVTLPS